MNWTLRFSLRISGGLLCFIAKAFMDSIDFWQEVERKIIGGSIGQSPRKLFCRA